MEKYHIEVEKAHLKLEKEAVNELKKSYEQALKDIQERVKYLQSDEALESKIRQLNYQRALETQITGILDVLKTDNIVTINKYLNEAYNNGFVGSLYCMQKENIPLAFGIDEKRVLTSISKKIENMTFADREETNMDDFKKKVKSEITRGIANGSKYSEIVRNLDNVTKEGVNSSYRICRTEMGRVSQEAKYDSMVKAKENGADIVKQWDSTMDGKTREAHAKLDGQVKEIDEPFEIDDMKAMYPMSFGIASMDINCRCVVLERARWAVESELKGESTFTKVIRNDDGKTEIKEFNTDSYNAFKKDYFKWKDEINISSVIDKNYNCHLAVKFGNEYYDEMHKLIAECENKNLVEVWMKYEDQIEVGDANYKGHEHCMGNKIYVNGTRDAKGNSYEKPYQVTFHESGHAIDNLAGKHESVKNSTSFFRHFSSRYKDGFFPQTIDKQLKADFKEHAGDVEWFRNNGFIDDWYYSMYQKGTYKAEQIIPKYRKSYAYSAIEKEIRALNPYAKSDLSDILEGATKGKINCGYGHGTKYWRDRTYDGVSDGLATEAFAEMTDSLMTNKESLETIKKYLPKSFEMNEEMLKIILS